jgi:uncharacterized protein
VSFPFISNNYLQTFFLLVLTLILHGCSKPSNITNNKLHEIKINGKTIHVEVASTQRERMLGLMFREKLEKDQGMLFIYPQEQYLSFWMKNTKIPLSIAFINFNGEITQIEAMIPYSLKSHVSKDKGRYALEMEEAWFKKNGIGVGSKVSFSAEISKINVR